MLNNKTTLEIKIDDRIYHFLCDSDSPIGEVYDVLSKMKSYVVEIIQRSEAKPESQDEKVVNE